MQPQPRNTWKPHELEQAKPGPPWSIGGQGLVMVVLVFLLHHDLKLLALSVVKEVSIGLSHQIPGTLLLEPKQTNWPLGTIETHVPKQLATFLGTLLLWRERRAPRYRYPVLHRSNPEWETISPVNPGTG